MRRAYLFAAEGIQRWVMEGDKLRDIAAASALLAWTASSDGDGDDNPDLLHLVLRQTEFGAKPSRRAGGAFMLHFDDADMGAFDRFRALWRLAFMRLLPGLEFIEGLSPDVEVDQDDVGKADMAAAGMAYRAGNQLSRGRENSPASLIPLGHPLSRMAQRTGRPATLRYGRTGEPGDDGEDLIDGATEAKRRADRFRGTVAEKLAEAFEVKPVGWPDQMEPVSEEAERSGAIAFPLRDDDDWIAVAHADVSGLGTFFTKLRERPGMTVEAVAAAARTIEEAVLAAAKTAAHEVLSPKAVNPAVAPARPVLLGGDDITLILRGDVAIPFMARFLEALETETLTRLTAFAKCYEQRPEGIAERLTAGAGIAFGGAKQPFFRLLRLADGLCGYAKARAKRAATHGAPPPSVLAFWRGTESSLSAEAADLLAREPGSCQPYRLGNQAASGFAEFAGLKAIRCALRLEALRAGRLREVRSLLAKERTSDANAVWSRWRQIAERQGGETALNDLYKGLREVWSSPNLNLESAACLTPVFDAMDWLAVEGRMEPGSRSTVVEDAA